MPIDETREEANKTTVNFLCQIQQMFVHTTNIFRILAECTLRWPTDLNQPDRTGAGSGELGGGWNEPNGGAALGLGLLGLADLLHLEHTLHDELVLALLVSVALGLALPG